MSQWYMGVSNIQQVIWGNTSQLGLLPQEGNTVFLFKRESIKITIYNRNTIKKLWGISAETCLFSCDQIPGKKKPTGEELILPPGLGDVPPRWWEDMMAGATSAAAGNG